MTEKKTELFMGISAISAERNRKFTEIFYPIISLGTQTQVFRVNCTCPTHVPQMKVQIVEFTVYGNLKSLRKHLNIICVDILLSDRSLLCLCIHKG